jgi:hypothetical protein
MPQALADKAQRIVLASTRITHVGPHRKDAKNAKKSRKMAGENLQCAEPAIVASIGFPSIKR